MTLSYFTLRKIAAELQEAIQSRRIYEVFSVPPHDLCLRVEGGACLLLSASPDRGRICLSKDPAQDRQAPPPWADRHLPKATVESVRQVPLEG